MRSLGERMLAPGRRWHAEPPRPRNTVALLSHVVLGERLILWILGRSRFTQALLAFWQQTEPCEPLFLKHLRLLATFHQNLA